MAKEVKTITGAEIFAVGTWNGTSFTSEDLDGIVAAFSALGLSGRVPLKLGHEGPDAREDPTSQFAMGWVMGVTRDGDRLLADLEVPSDVYEMIQEGRLKFVSVELLRNVKASTRVVPWVLDAVALLGTDQPAVGVLKDLQALTLARDFTFESVAVFTKVDRRQANNQDTGDRKAMSEPTVIELATQNAQLQRQVDELQGTALKLETAERRLAEATEKYERERIERHRAALKDVIEAAVREEKILPAARERFYRTHKIDTPAVMQLDVNDAHEFVRDNPNPDYKATARRPTRMMSRSSDEAPADMPADDELGARALLLCRESGRDVNNAEHMVKATLEVIRAFPELGERYKTLPADREAAAV